MEAIRARSLFAFLISLVWLAPLRAAGPLGAVGAGAQNREPGGGAGLGIPRSPTLPLDSEDAHWKTEIAASYSALDRLVLCSTVFQDHLILGGDFTTAGVRSVNGVASWDGREWSPLGGGMNGPVLALTVFDGKLYAGGAFTSAGGMPADHIACWDGTAWAPLGNGTDAAVRSFTVFDRRLIAGGEFHQAGGRPAEGIAVWDGEAWSPMGAGLDGRVFALAVYAGTVFAGGDFIADGDSLARNLAAWDGGSWTAPVRGLDVPVRAMAVYRHDLIVGGYAVFSGWGFGPYAIPLLGVFDGRSWRDMSGEVGSFGCAALAIYDDELVAGGGVNGGCGYEFPYNGAVLSWNGRSWTPRTGDSGVTSGAIGTLVEWDGRLIAGGGFEAVNGVVTGRAAAWDGSAWSALGSAVRRRSELVAFRDELITEGAITRAGGNRDGITGMVSWNGRSWKNIGPEFPFSQGCLTVGLCPGACVIGGNTSIAFPLGTFRDRLLIGGYIGDWYAARCVFAWDGSATSPVGEGLNGAALRMVEYHDRLIMVGPLSLNAVDLRGVVTWDGTSWASLGTEHPDFSYSVTDMTVYDDTVILAVWGTAPDRLRTWDGISWSYLGDGLQATIGGIRAFCTYRDRLIAGGVFTVAGGVGANHIAAWNGSSWEPLGSGLDGPVLALAVYDGRVVAGGDFTAAGGLPANHLAAWDGETWSPLGSGVNGLVNQIVPFRGDLVVEGTFTMAGGKSSPYLATWSSRDEVEAAFDVKPGACPNPINGSVDGGAGKSVVPAAILGSAGFDVHEIDPSTVTVNGEPVIRWGYEDVGSPGDGPEDECACPGTGGDGYDDLTLKVSRAALVASLNEAAGGSGESPGRASAGAVPGPPARARYTVRVQGRLEDGTGFHGSDCVVLVGPGTEFGGAEAGDAPGVDVLGNDPNPFDRKTRISFRLATSTPVRLEVFDVAGRRVATLADGVMGAGRQSIAWDGSRAAAGIYYYRLKAGDQVLTRRMLLLK